jgi:uncharacterized protein (DUF111 family)
VLKRRKSSDAGDPKVAGDAIDDLELDESEADPNAVSGGRVPAPPGPVPIPYPIVGGK